MFKKIAKKATDVRDNVREFVEEIELYEVVVLGLATIGGLAVAITSFALADHLGYENAKRINEESNANTIYYTDEEPQQ